MVNLFELTLHLLNDQMHKYVSIYLNDCVNKIFIQEYLSHNLILLCLFYLQQL